MFSTMIQVFAVVIWTFATFFVSRIELYESCDIPKLMIGRNEFTARCCDKPFTASWFLFRFHFLVAVFSIEAKFYLQQELFEFLGAFCSLFTKYFLLFRAVSLSTVCQRELFWSKRAVWVFRNGPTWPTFHWNLLFLARLSFITHSSSWQPGFAIHRISP